MVDTAFIRAVERALLCEGAFGYHDPDSPLAQTSYANPLLAARIFEWQDTAKCDPATFLQRVVKFLPATDSLFMTEFSLECLPMALMQMQQGYVDAFTCFMALVMEACHPIYICAYTLPLPTDLYALHVCVGQRLLNAVLFYSQVVGPDPISMCRLTHYPVQELPPFYGVPVTSGRFAAEFIEYAPSVVDYGVPFTFEDNQLFMKYVVRVQEPGTDTVRLLACFDHGFRIDNVEIRMLVGDNLWHIGYTKLTKDDELGPVRLFTFGPQPGYVHKEVDLVAQAMFVCDGLGHVIPQADTLPHSVWYPSLCVNSRLLVCHHQVRWLLAHILTMYLLRLVSARPRNNQPHSPAPQTPVHCHSPLFTCPPDILTRPPTYRLEAQRPFGGATLVTPERFCSGDEAPFAVYPCAKECVVTFETDHCTILALAANSADNVARRMALSFDQHECKEPFLLVHAHDLAGPMDLDSAIMMESIVGLELPLMQLIPDLEL